jgi:DNA-binding MarR family transcriptional regulator
VVSSGSSSDPLPAKIVDALERLARGQRRFRQATASRHGLTPLQLDLLTAVAGGPPPQPTVGLLARELGVTQPTITDSVGTLEAKGLVARARSPRDRRQTHVTLTRSGRALIVDVVVADRVLADTVARMPRHNQESTLEVLLALIGAMVDAGIIDVARTCGTCRFHRYAPETGHRCALLGIPLLPADLRVNCPEHERAAG